MSETITLQRDEYERLFESEALFRQVADSAPVLIWLSGTDARYTWFNKPWLTFRGRTLEQEIGNGWTEDLHPDDLDRYRDAFRDSFQQRTPFRTEYRLLAADGKYRWLLDHGIPRYSTAGIFLGYIGSVMDITEQRRARELQQTLSTRLGQFAAIVESSDDVIVSKDLDGTITSWNPAAERVFGYSAEEMIGQSILKLIPKHLYSDEEKIISQIRSGKRVDHFETVRLTKSGQLLEVSLTISPVKDGNGVVVGASKILRDISSRKRIEESLLQAEKIAATGRMAATISHEINNPLESVMNLLYLLRPAINSKEGLAYLDAAEGELARVSHIAKQTLGYYRENASAKSASLAEIVEHVISIYKPRCIAAMIEIHASLTSERRAVVRRGEMIQVISNLITNSIYAMPNGGVLSISVTDSAHGPDGIVLSIQDNGVGISPVDLPRVFEAFFTRRSDVGTGIGLFVAQGFVEGHGGTITIDSNTEPDTHGTKVSVFIPAETPYAAASGR